MSECGKMINRKDMEVKLGKTVQNMKVNFCKARNMEKVFNNIYLMKRKIQLVRWIGLYWGLVRKQDFGIWSLLMDGWKMF